MDARPFQVGYFGTNNRLADPNADANGTGQTNRFKYLAGLNPLDRSSVFTVFVGTVAGAADKRTIRFAPTVAGRTHTVLTGTDLAHRMPLTSSSTVDNGSERTVTDLSATGPRRFYRVQISLP